MRDEERLCQCGKKHKWGIIAKSEGGVPLYGPRPVPDCEYFRPQTDQLPQFVGDLRELWSQTGDLDAQATLATRTVVARLRSLDPVAQWPEFVGFVISQITSLRGSLLRDESKFAHLVAHTDNIVETMQNVGLLTERLKKQEKMLSQISDQLDDLLMERTMNEDDGEDEALRHFGLVEPDESGFVRSRWTASRPEEPVLVESERDHARDENNDRDDQSGEENGGDDGEDDDEDE